MEGLIEMLMFEQKLERCVCGGKADSQCKGPEVGMSLWCLENQGGKGQGWEIRSEQWDRSRWAS